jgi:hypothetical protein
MIDHLFFGNKFRTKIALYFIVEGAFFLVMGLLFRKNVVLGTEFAYQLH